MKTNLDEYGISPVIAIVLIVGVTVALVAIAGFTVFDYQYSGGGTPVASISTDELGENRTTFMVPSMRDDSTKLEVVTPMGTKIDVSQVGSQATVLNVANRGPVRIVATDDKGEETLIRSKPAQDVNADIYVDKNGTEDYKKIQWGIDNATSGDVIVVERERYTENITIDKDVTLLGEPGTVIEGNVTITADGVTFKYFKVTG